MLKPLIKRYVPDAEFFKNHKNLQFLGNKLHDPNLWHLNRRSASRACAIGLFCALIPLPAQMALAAIGAFYFRANLPISVALVWLSNPVTTPVLVYCAYQMGLWALGQQPLHETFEFSAAWFLDGVGDASGPFLLGSLILALLASAVGYGVLQWFWCYHTLKRWDERKRRRMGLDY